MRETIASRLRANGAFVAWLGAPLLVLLALLRLPALDLGHQSVSHHLYVVSAIAACALGLAVVAGIAALRVRRAGVVLLAAGCLSAGTFMLIHGLVTPHGDRPMNMWIGRAPVLAVLVFALCQGAAALAPTTRVARLLGAHALAVLVAVAATVGTLATVVVVRPTALHGGDALPGEHDLARALCALAVVVLLPTARVHWRRYRLGRDSLQAVLTVAAAMNIAAIVSMQYGVLWHLSWWTYHLYLLGAFAAVVFTILRRYRGTRTVEDVLDHTFAVDPLEHIALDYPDALHDLVTAVEVKDSYTHGHSRRTAEVATALGARLGLAPEQLRILAQGAYLHDVGKIAVPDEILNKPGRLDSEEREVIEQHAAAGAEIVARAPALADCVAIVRHHHERVDGRGYPDEIAGDDIPFLARVTAVADVWDALISDRAYRPGWVPERALAHIVAGSGTHFDEVVVQALVELAREWGYRTDRGLGEIEAAWRAAQECHEVRDSRVPVLNRP